MGLVILDTFKCVSNDIVVITTTGTDDHTTTFQVLFNLELCDPAALKGQSTTDSSKI